jgi:hypothetical protein
MPFFPKVFGEVKGHRFATARAAQPTPKINLMTTLSQESNDLSIVHGGLSYHVGRRLGFRHPESPRRLRKALLLILVTWVPLLLLSLVTGRAYGDRVAVALLHDPVIFSRFLFVVPLLVIAEIAVGTSLRTQARYFLDSGIVPEGEQPRFESARAAVVALRNSTVAEAVILALAFVMSLVVRVVIGIAPQETTWERSGTTISLAGWWYILVSLPILFFVLLRWLWIFLLYAWFLFKVSRLDLELTPTHPDHSGGLGFLGWGLASFAVVLLAVSAVMSGGLAYEIINRGSSLNSLKYHVIVFVVAAIAIVHAPLFVFTGRLARCRFKGLLDFGALIGSHDRAFDEKWLKSRGTNPASLLGSPDVESLSDAALIYEHVERMQILPFDKKAVVVLVVAALIPMVPLVGTAIPLEQILAKLAEFMV